MSLAFVRKIGILDVGAADESHRLVGDDQLLVVPDQVSGSVAWVEDAIVAASIADGPEEFRLGRRASKTVDKQPHEHAALGRFNEGIADSPTRFVTVEDVEDEAKALLRTCNDFQQFFEARCPAFDQLKPIALNDRADRAVCWSSSVRLVGHAAGVPVGCCPRKTSGLGKLGESLTFRPLNP